MLYSGFIQEEFKERMEKLKFEKIKLEQRLVDININENIPEVTEENIKQLCSKFKEFVINIERGLDGTIKSILITGRICWGIVLGSIAVSITVIVASAPTSNVAHIVTAPVAITTIGSSAAISATTIAMKAGSIKILSKLRKYRIVRETNEGMIIARY